MRPRRGREQPVRRLRMSLCGARAKMSITRYYTAVCATSLGVSLRRRPRTPGRASPVPRERARSARSRVDFSVELCPGSTVTPRPFRRALPGLRSHASTFPPSSAWAPQSRFDLSAELCLGSAVTLRSSCATSPGLRSHASIVLSERAWAPQPPLPLRTKSAWAPRSRLDRSAQPPLGSAATLRSSCRGVPGLHGLCSRPDKVRPGSTVTLRSSRSSPPGLPGHASSALRTCDLAARWPRARFAQASPALSWRPSMADRVSV
jgi:hypothetical protein